MEKLKRTGKYEEYKQKKAANRKRLHSEKKVEERDIPPGQLAQIAEARRIAVRNRVRKHREKLKQRVIDENLDPNLDESGYRCANTLGKAAKKVERTLPAEAGRRATVL